VLGIVENMATHICSNCGFEENIFGSGGAQHLAAEYGVSLLASLPLDSQVREHVDAGEPSVVKDPHSAISRAYIELANKVSVELWKCNKDTAPVPIMQVSE
jgi:ATP-binding protein involved in chromosome partitioning